jgi:hypothetical protein
VLLRLFGRGALAGLLTALTAHPACNLAFRCGCSWLWSGGTAHCNIRVPGPPDCPVCTNVLVGAPFAAALFGLWWVAVTLAVRAVSQPRE